MRVCTRCGKRKKNSDFGKNRSKRSGYCYSCKECVNEFSRKQTEADPVKRATTARRSLLRTYYGLTEEQYEELLSKQNGCCGVCRRHYSEFKRRLSVDHDHSDFSIRGLLCDYCNRFIIGRLRSGNGGIELLQHASQYLAGPYSGLFAPGNTKKRRKRKRK